MRTDQLYNSITTPEVMHDEANFMTELIFLNRDINFKEYPWKQSKALGIEWGRTVACLKKLMRDFDLTSDQLAFYIYKCHPVDINGNEFAKMAVVAKKLFQKYNLDDLARMFRERREALRTRGIDDTGYKQQKQKSLVDFIKELENGKA